MSKVLHLFRSKPDQTVSRFIAEMSGDSADTLCLYPDIDTGVPVDWDHVIEEIMSHEKVVSWW